MLGTWDSHPSFEVLERIELFLVFVCGPYPVVLRGHSWLCDLKLLLTGSEDLCEMPGISHGSTKCKANALTLEMSLEEDENLQRGD